MKSGADINHHRLDRIAIAQFAAVCGPRSWLQMTTTTTTPRRFSVDDDADEGESAKNQ